MLLAAAEQAEQAGQTAPLDEHQVLVLLVQLLLLVGVARLLGGLMKRIGQPSVVGELLAGVLLGPSLFGAVLPGGYAWVFTDEPVVTSTVFGFAWLGVIMLLVVIGFETDLSIIRRFAKAALFVSAGSLLIPLATGATMGLLAPDSFVGEGAQPAIFAGFFALALAVSALPVVAKILLDLGFLRRNFGQITLAAGMTMDSVGWLILAALAGIARENALDLPHLGRSIGGLVLFLLIAVTVGRWFIDQALRRIMAAGSSTAAALTVTLMAAVAGAAVTQALELEAILGAFIVGILLATTRHQVVSVRHTIEDLTAAFFAPIFFAFSGLRVDLGALASTEAALWAFGVVVVAILAKVGGTYLGARLGGLDRREGLALGSGLSALGAMGIVVALVGLNLGVLSDTGYTVLVLAAIATSVLSPFFLRLSVRNLTTPADEAARLEKEALKERSVILGSHRILLPTRGGRNSAYAARLVAAIFDESEVGVLAIDVVSGPWWSRLRNRALAGSSAGPDDVIEALGPVASRVIKRVARDPSEAIVEESKLGYHMLVMGASDDEAQAGLFSTVVDRVVAGVDIPSMIVRFPATTAVPDRPPARILVPVTASASTKAAEELSYSVAARHDGSVMALHVINKPDEQPGMVPDERLVDEGRRVAAELLADATQLGSRLGVRVDTLVRVARNPEQEIVDLANGGEFDLLVLGTAHRPLTNRPFFGHRVNYIIEHSTIPVMIVSIRA